MFPGEMDYYANKIGIVNVIDCDNQCQARVHAYVITDIQNYIILHAVWLLHVAMQLYVDSQMHNYDAMYLNIATCRLLNIVLKNMSDCRHG